MQVDRLVGATGTVVAATPAATPAPAPPPAQPDMPPPAVSPPAAPPAAPPGPPGAEADDDEAERDEAAALAEEEAVVVEEPYESINIFDLNVFTSLYPQILRVRPRLSRIRASVVSIIIKP